MKNIEETGADVVGQHGGSIPEASQRKVTALLMCLQLVREGMSQYCTSVNRVGRCETENC